MPLRYVRPLEPAERVALRQQFKTSADVRLVHRSQAMLLSAEGWPVPRIAALLRVDQSTVHRWLDRFETRGVAGLAIQWGPGRPPRWDEAYERCSSRLRATRPVGTGGSRRCGLAHCWRTIWPSRRAFA